MSTATQHFEILEIPGGGAYATVCVAEDSTGRRVALKVLKADFARDIDVLKRTRDEARMLHRLRHPNIVEVDALLAIAGRPVVVMEYVDGMPLDKLVRELRHGMPVAEALDVARQVALALDAAYNEPVGSRQRPLRVVHRDIKPSNVLISVGGSVKLTDFGVAKGEFDDREAQSLYLVHGSRGYMAPERYIGGRDTPAVDVYALGLTLFQTLTGKPMVVSVSEDKHDPGVLKVLPFLVAEGVAPERVDELRGLVREMCTFRAEARPTPRAVADRISEWLGRAGLQPDLARYGREVIHPMRLKRRKIPPNRHALWREVSFLHSGDAVSDLRALPTDELGERPHPREVDALIRRRLLLPGWTVHAAELRAATRGRNDWSVGPFVDMLREALVPPWQFWRKPLPVAQIRLALELLEHRHDPLIAPVALRLTKHPDAEVAERARHLVDGA